MMTHVRGGGESKMAAPMEVAVCTDSAAPMWSCIVWELHSGANLLTYRGGQAGPRGLALLNGEYLLAAQLGKNYISAWELQRKDQLQQKIMCPGPVTCLTTSPNGLYVLAGVAESIHLWEVSTGNLLVILSRHYQDVSCLQFTGDSSHFISGGKDCLVLAWSLCSVLQADPSRIPAPRHVWSHHTLPITDLHCGFGGPLARVATSSLDQTVKLWEVSSGELLLSVLFDVSIMAVTMDLAEHHMFCGGSEGSIFQVDLFSWPGQRERSFQPEQDAGKVFKGHRNQVTCLSVSTDGSVLLSGSHDETVRLWDVQSKQCIRTVALKGPVTNATILLAPVSMLSSDFRPSLPLPHFNKHLLGAEHGDDPRHGGLTLRLGLHQQCGPRGSEKLTTPRPPASRAELRAPHTSLPAAGDPTTVRSFCKGPMPHILGCEGQKVHVWAAEGAGAAVGAGSRWGPGGCRWLLCELGAASRPGHSHALTPCSSAPTLALCRY
ncbi:WD repeat-containing protein 18 isoform X1 [Symphalangus syndactylus]|uniref:WD repeat-containing protein 18 isoform X1 n=1 Tax=Symphalangus syndactylus TaxID=9590 RepID=UPI0030073F10